MENTKVSVLVMFITHVLDSSYVAVYGEESNVIAKDKSIVKGSVEAHDSAIMKAPTSRTKLATPKEFYAPKNLTFPKKSDILYTQDEERKQNSSLPSVIFKYEKANSTNHWCGR